MLTDKIINAFETNAKFNEVLFSLMNLQKDLVCNLILAPTISDVLDILMRAENASKAAYILTAKEFFYVSAEKRQPVQIQFSYEKFTELKEYIDKEFLGAKDVVELTEESLSKIKNITSHQHYDEQAQDNKIALMNILLSRGRRYEKWRENHYENSEYSASSHKLLIAEYLNIFSDLISDLLKIKLPIVDVTLDQNAAVIGAHNERREVYQKANKMLVQKKYTGTSVVSIEQEIYKCIEDFFTLNNNTDLAAPAKKTDMEELLDKSMVRSEERVKRFFIRKGVKIVKPGQEQTYEATIQNGSSIRFKKVEISNEKIAKIDKLFVALGTTRSEVTKVLYKNQDNIEIRKRFVKEIRNALMAENDVRFKDLYGNDVFKKLKNASQENSSTEYDDIDHHCLQVHVYRDYIKFGIEKDLPLSHAAILGFAQYKHLNINLWESHGVDNSKIVLKDYGVSERAVETIDLLNIDSAEQMCVLVRYDHTSKSAPYDMLNNQQIDEYFEKTNQNNATPSHISDYRYSLTRYAEARDKFHQNNFDLDNESAIKFITGSLDDLRKNLSSSIQSESLYSNLISYFFNYLHSMVRIGHAVLSRTPGIVKQAEKAYIILNQRLSAELNNQIRIIPYQVRKNLDSNHKYKKSTAHLIERMNSIKQLMETNGSTFFMWSIAQIKYYIMNIKGKDYFKNPKNLFPLIDTLSTYHDLTLYYWEDFKNLHENSDQWVTDFQDLIIEPQLQEKLNSEEISKFYKPDVIKSYRNKLNTLLFTKANLSTHGKLTTNIVETILEITDLQSTLEYDNKADLSTLLLRYLYTSLYHMDVFKDSKEITYQWILQIQSFLHMLKKILSPDDTAHKIFIDELSDMLKSQVNEQRLTGKVQVDVNLNMRAIIDLISKYGYALNLGVLYSSEGHKFRESLVNSHIANKTIDFKNNLDNIQKRFYDEIELVYSDFVQQELFSAPISVNFIDTHDNLVVFFEQVKARDYQSENIAKDQKINFVKNKVNEFEKSAHELLGKHDVFFDDEGLSIEMKKQLKLFNELYDCIIFAILQGLPKNQSMSRAYRRTIISALDAANDSPSVIGKLKTFHDKLANDNSASILNYFINPAFLNVKKGGSIPLSIFLRHAIVKNLKILLIEHFNTPDNYSDEYLDFLCNLLDSVTLEIKLKLTAYKMNVSSLVDVSNLHAAHTLLLHAHCPASEDLNIFKQEIINMSTLLLDEGQQTDTKELIKKVDQYIVQHGKVSGNLWMSLPINDNLNIQAAKALIDLTQALYDVNRINCGSILLNTLLNNIFIIPEPMYKVEEKIKEKVVERNVSYCYMLNELEQIFLPLHTFNRNGQTLLHEAIDHKLNYIAGKLIAQGLSVAFENEKNTSCCEYVLKKITDCVWKSTEPTVDVVILGMRDMRGISRQDDFYIVNSLRNAGVPRKNISFIEGTAGAANRYSKHLNGAENSYPNDFLGYIARLTDILFRDSVLLGSRIMSRDELRRLLVIHTLQGFNAFELRKEVVLLKNDVSGKHYGFFTQSRFVRDLEALLIAYPEDALVPLPPRNLKMNSNNSSSSGSKSTNEHEVEHLKNTVKELKISEHTAIRRADEAQSAAEAAIRREQESSARTKILEDELALYRARKLSTSTAQVPYSALVVNTESIVVGANSGASTSENKLETEAMPVEKENEVFSYQN